MYFFNIKNNVFTKTFIQRKIYLIKNLKINMLINNNIIISKNIVINIKKQKTNICSCNVIMLLKVRFKTFYVQQRFIYAKKIVVLSSRV